MTTILYIGKDKEYLSKFGQMEGFLIIRCMNHPENNTKEYLLGLL